MLDITAIILTYNEELHIRRCLENVNQFAKKVYVIDCFSKDKTVEIAESMGATVIQHQWPGNQAEQFNWALENIEIDTEWVLRLDADEYCSEELIKEMQQELPIMPNDVYAVVLPLGRVFMGRKLKHGIANGIKMIRLFRNGKAKYEKRIMDEHLSVAEGGKTVTFKHPFYDASMISIAQFVDKHNKYAAREAALLLDAEFNLTANKNEENSYCEEVVAKRKQKEKYAKMKIFWRSFFYFCYRYILKLGFIDGKEGFVWDFMQGWWYRTLVDTIVFETKKACGNDKEKIIAHLKEHYNIVL